MVHNVSVVGAGQLGSRHLQGLANCGVPLSIHLVDPSAQSLDLAQERFAAIPGSERHCLKTVDTVGDLPADLTFVIVACTADSRFSIYKDLVEHKNARVILLEKVLFQDLDQYPQAIALDARSATRTYVNLAQRYWPFFCKLRDEVADKTQLTVTITGSNWGLGCNAVHNVDIAEFIWGTAGDTVARLDPALRESKRPNCYEFTGIIETVMPGGGRLTQTCYSEGTAPFVVTAQTPDFMWIWDVSNGRIQRADSATEWRFDERELIAPFQSNLTTRLIDDLLAGRELSLPDVCAASETHVTILSEMLRSCRANSHDFGRICPVT